jgi:hypothetical protein
MDQGITSTTNEVIVGENSWIGINAVIVGNVHIGRGCVIGANSYLTEDIPDYCVAVGSPARVVKAFDYISYEWISIKSQNELNELLENREKSNPVLTISIPTHNDIAHLGSCLRSIFNQIGSDKQFQVVVYDNNSQDETDMVVSKYMNRYSNLKYHKNETTIDEVENISESKMFGEGSYVLSHRAEDYFSYLSLYQILNIIYKNKDCSAIKIENCDRGEIKVYHDLNEYMKENSTNYTVISNVIFKRSELS